MSTILSSISGATLTGSSTSDLIIALGNGDLILAGKGDDTVLAYGNNDLIWGGAGNDFLTSWGNNNILMGGAGNDTILAYGRMTSIYTGTGENTVTAGNDSIKVIGSTGMDFVTVLGNNNLVEAGTGGSLVVVEGSNNTVLYNAHLNAHFNADHASFYYADKKAGNMLIISVDKSLENTEVITNLKKNFLTFEVGKNTLFDFSSYKLDAAGTSYLKVQGFSSLLINTNPDAISETLAVVLNPLLSTSSSIVQNVLLNDKDQDSNLSRDGKVIPLSISDVQSVTIEGKDASKVVVTESASWDIAGGIVKQYELKTDLGTAILKMNKDGTETLIDNHAFDKMAIDLKVTYQISDGRGGHDVATSTFNLTSVIPVPPVSSHVSVNGALTSAIIPIDITNLFSGLTGPITYKLVEGDKVIADAVVIKDAQGHLILQESSAALYKALEGAVTGTEAIKIMAIDANNTAKLGQIDYTVTLPVASSQVSNTMVLSSNTLSIDITNMFPNLTGALTYKVLDNLSGEVIENAVVTRDASGKLLLQGPTSTLLDDLTGPSGVEKIYVVAMDANHVTTVGEINYTVLLPQVSTHLATSGNLGSQNVSIDITSLFPNLTGSEITYKVFDTPTGDVISGAFVSRNAEGKLILQGNSKFLFDDLNNSTGMEKIYVVATDANHISQMGEVDYTVTLPPVSAVALKSGALTENMSININNLFPGIGENVTYKVIDPTAGKIIETASVKVDPTFGPVSIEGPAADLFNDLKGATGMEKIYVLATDNITHASRLAEIDYTVTLPIVSKTLALSGSIMSSDVRIDLGNLFPNITDKDVTYKVFEDSSGALKEGATVTKDLYGNLILQGKSSTLFDDLTGPTGAEKFYVMAITANNISTLAEINYNVVMPYITEYATRGNLVDYNTTVSIDVSSLFSELGEGRTYKVVPGGPAGATIAEDANGRVILKENGSLLLNTPQDSNPAHVFKIYLTATDANHVSKAGELTYVVVDPTVIDRSIYSQNLDSYITVDSSGKPVVALDYTDGHGGHAIYKQNAGTYENAGEAIYLKTNYGSDHVTLIDVKDQPATVYGDIKYDDISEYSSGLHLGNNIIQVDGNNIQMYGNIETLGTSKTNIFFGDDVLTNLLSSPTAGSKSFMVGDINNLDDMGSRPGFDGKKFIFNFGSDTFNGGLTETVTMIGDVNVFNPDNSNAPVYDIFNPRSMENYASETATQTIGGTDTFNVGTGTTNIAPGFGNNVFNFFIAMNEDGKLSLTDSTFTHFAGNITDSIHNFRDKYNWNPNPIEDKITFIAKDQFTADMVASHIKIEAGASDFLASTTNMVLDGGQTISLNHVLLRQYPMNMDNLYSVEVA